jgi:hypothetical protein
MQGRVQPTKIIPDPLRIWIRIRNAYVSCDAGRETKLLRCKKCLITFLTVKDYNYIIIYYIKLSFGLLLGNTSLKLINFAIC